MLDLKMLPAIGFATALALGAASAANAAFLNGTFSIDIYTYDAGGNSANANADLATLARVTSGDLSGTVVRTNTVTYTGLLDFATFGGSTDISDFLNSGTGSYNPDPLAQDGLMTAGGFTTTSIFDIRGSTGPILGSIEHDDGITLYEGDGMMGWLAVTPASAASPTVAVDTDYSLSGGEFRLIYSAANGNPEVLQMSVVPLPAPILLLLGGIAGLGFVSRKRKAA